MLAGVSSDNFLEHFVGLAAVSDYNKRKFAERVVDEGSQFLRVGSCLLLGVHHDWPIALAMQMNDARLGEIVHSFRRRHAKVVDGGITGEKSARTSQHRIEIEGEDPPHELRANQTRECDMRPIDFCLAKMGFEQLFSLTQRQRAHAATVIILLLRLDQSLDLVRILLLDFLDQLRSQRNARGQRATGASEKRHASIASYRPRKDPYVVFGEFGHGAI